MPWTFWIALVPGGALVVIGLRGLIVDHASTNPVASIKILIGLSLASDLVFIPVALAIGILVGRLLPRWLSRPLKGGIFAAAVISVFALPAVNRWGAEATNPTVLPRDYLRGLVEVLILIAVATAAVSIMSWYAERSKVRRHTAV